MKLRCGTDTSCMGQTPLFVWDDLGCTRVFKNKKGNDIYSAHTYAGICAYMPAHAGKFVQACEYHSHVD